MFSHPDTKFDMFSEMNAGKLILINTSKSLLKEQGTQIFGRFFIALIAQAAQERATLQDRDRLPANIYIDEAQDYFDQTLSVILSQARKYRVGMTMAHQYLGQLTSGLQEAFEANTSIKMAGGVSQRDARALSGMMGCDPDLITSLSKGTFATSIRGVTNRAVPLSFPFFVLENRQRADAKTLADIIEHSRTAYASPWRAKGSDDPPEEPQDPDPVPENPDDDPLKPSSEL